ncbi:hypothetical protein M378DRAFT_171758 [Amanita muscaria Koide BX008]|uniref:Uncharacterized protein n=1 Tax=Amanita muscaria (strain Koide BX008) TaxID=946122 RepID=A0A0C2W8D5_AMAMK|nr:hypothetical protein M378DRAFT_171758 [Amanita muscaria Koide BX008]
MHHTCGFQRLSYSVQVNFSQNAMNTSLTLFRALKLMQARGVHPLCSDLQRFRVLGNLRLPLVTFYAHEN